MTALIAFLRSGTPPHWALLLAFAWVALSFVISKFPAVRANTTAELIFNAVNPKVIPILQVIPVVGPALAAILAALDTPQPATALALPQVPGTSLKVVLPFLLLPALLAASCDFCQQAANKDTARCKAERVVTNCGAPEVAKIVLDIAGQVAQALASDNFTPLLDGIVLDLEHRGITDAWGIVTCAIHQSTSTALAKSSPIEAIKYAHAQSWLSKHPAKTVGATPGAPHAARVLPRLQVDEAHGCRPCMPRLARGLAA